MSEKADATPQKFESWGIVEIMGHSQLAGRITEAKIAGTVLLRVDVPQSIEGESAFRTEYVGGNSIYRMRVTTEEVARAFAQSRCESEPTYAYGLRMQPSNALPAPAEDGGTMSFGRRTGVGYDPDEEFEDLGQ
jgi:hypothetical protein